MEEHVRRDGDRQEDNFHPLIYALMAGVVAWLVVMAWLVFGIDTYAGVMLMVVTFTAIGFLAVPFVFWLLSGERGEPVREPLRDWAAHTFETWGDRLRGRDAALNALMAPAAAALTLTLAGLVAYWVLHANP
ncbi:hypothetical protein HRbin40_01601 [bacterium HR40]|nr:hypothetical protein HRbin40_01601 [bacterium HR40]